jgi:hypothetical protein
LRNSLAILKSDGSAVDYIYVNMHAVEEIYGNVWMSNVISPSGQIGFGLESQYMKAYMNSTTSKVQWSVEVGCLADRSYVGQSCTPSSITSNLYIGSGNYSLVLPDVTVDETVTLKKTTENNYNINALWFGNYYESMTPVGYSGSSLKCDIALNFQGLGLPKYEYNQLVSMLFKTNELVS